MSGEHETHGCAMKQTALSKRLCALQLIIASIATCVAATIDAAPTLSVNVAASRHAISDDIYGMNFADEAHNAECLRTVLLDPPSQILKRGGVEFEAPHSASFWITASRRRPSERCAAASRRCFIVSDFRR